MTDVKVAFLMATDMYGFEFVSDQVQEITKTLIEMRSNGNSFEDFLEYVKEKDQNIQIIAEAFINDQIASQPG